MRRAVRVGLDVTLAIAVVALGAYAVAGPSSPGPAAQPSDTYTRVDVVLDRAGLHVNPARVPAGQVEFAFADQRTSAHAVAVVTTDPVTSSFTDGVPELVEMRQLRAYTVRVFDAGESRPLATTSVRVVVPTLAAPREPTNQVAVEVRADGITASRRDTRLEEPQLVAATSASVADAMPWTEVTPGPVTVDVRNRTGTALSCTAAGVAARIGSGDRAQLRVVIPPTPGPSAITCNGRAVVQRLDLWVNA